MTAGIIRKVLFDRDQAGYCDSGDFPIAVKSVALMHSGARLCVISQVPDICKRPATY